MVFSVVFLNCRHMKITSKNVFLVPDGTYTVSPNLLLIVRGNTRRFVFRYSIAKVRKDKAIGAARKISLAQAKLLADELRRKLVLGEELTLKRDEIKSEACIQKTPLFKDYAKDVIAKIASVKLWKNKKHQSQWTNTIETYAIPVIGNKRVNEITRKDIVEILNPIWLTKNETASRVRGRLDNIFSYAVTDGYLQSNPAIWRGNLEREFPPKTKVRKVKHHESISLPQLQEKIKCFLPANNRTRQVILFTILTASRVGESVPARWDEIDFKNKVWSVPSERRKDGKPYPHRVPLSSQAIDLLKSIEKKSDAIFGFDKDNLGSRYSLTVLLKRMTGLPVTMHGFRSTFRDWAAENGVPDVIAEKCLMHTTGNAVVQAYQRSDLLEQRREVMQKWADAVFVATGDET